MVSLRCLNPFCGKPWQESGRWPAQCPFCGSKRIRKVTP